jgi:hypothetical protein
METIRRWHELRTLSVWWPAFLDDVLIGACLLYGAHRTARDASSGWPVLAASWAFMCGMAYSSFFLQLASLTDPDPSGLPPVMVVAVKALGLILGILGLAGAFRGRNAV